MDKYRYDYYLEKNPDEELDVDSSNQTFSDNWEQFPEDKLKIGRDNEIRSINDFDVKEDVKVDTLTPQQVKKALGLRFADKMKVWS